MGLFTWFFGGSRNWHPFDGEIPHRLGAITLDADCVCHWSDAVLAKHEHRKHKYRRCGREQESGALRGCCN